MAPNICIHILWFKTTHLYEIHNDKTRAVAIGKQTKAGVDRETQDCWRCLSVYPGRQTDLRPNIKVFRYSNIQTPKYFSCFFLSQFDTRCLLTRSGWKPPGFFTAPPRTWNINNQHFTQTQDIFSQGYNFLEDFPAMITKMFKCEQAKGNYIFFGMVPFTNGMVSLLIVLYYFWGDKPSIQFLFKRLVQMYLKEKV